MIRYKIITCYNQKNCMMDQVSNVSIELAVGDGPKVWMFLGDESVLFSAKVVFSITSKVVGIPLAGFAIPYLVGVLWRHRNFSNWLRFVGFATSKAWQNGSAENLSELA